ncbi:MAG: FtsX-like permease family protein [Polyangiaceae bacterium]|nr:FtsX-like permease family protein [Polyangiaceae bacterium]
MTLIELAARNVLRNKVRTLLTVAGVAVAVLTFLLLRTVIYSWTAGVDAAATDRLVTRHKVTFVLELPLRYFEDVRMVPGVRVATFANWFGGKDPQHPNDFFQTLAVEPDTFFDVYSEMKLPATELAAFKQNRQGAVVGDVIAAKLGWKVGDRITLESPIFPTPPDQPWTFMVEGIYEATSKAVDRSTVVFHWKYINDAMPEVRKDEIGWVVSRVDDPSRAAEVASAIDRAFETRDTQTMTQDERAFASSFMASFSAVLSALDIVSVGILLIMLLVLGNTIAMGVRERTNEYGVLRALGFSPSHIAGFIVGESLVVGALGGALGLLISYPIVNRGIGNWLEENMGAMFPYFQVTPLLATIAFALALALGLVAAAVPAWGASRLNVTDALRRVA